MCSLPEILSDIIFFSLTDKLGSSGNIVSDLEPFVRKGFSIPNIVCPRTKRYLCNQLQNKKQSFPTCVRLKSKIVLEAIANKISGCTEGKNTRNAFETKAGCLTGFCYIIKNTWGLKTYSCGHLTSE